MSEYRIIDTFPSFMAFWKEAQGKPLDAQVDDWASEYMSQWSELLQKQVEDYTSQDVEWRQIAREKVLPFLSERLPAMRTARTNLLASCAPIYAAAQEALGFESDIIFVIYVGIGCGAGWATTFQDWPAVLFGLENIAECDWSQPSSIAGLVAHEIGHLVHHLWRGQHKRPEGSGPWWQLYEEGFAQRCEHLILGEETWHQSTGADGEAWLQWCQDHKSWLAAEFLRRVDEGESVRPFFGSWFDIRGWRQCGYFLGHELVRELEVSMSLKEIALLDEVEERFRRILERIPHQG